MKAWANVIAPVLTVLAYQIRCDACVPSVFARTARSSASPGDEDKADANKATDVPSDGSLSDKPPAAKLSGKPLAAKGIRVLTKRPHFDELSAARPKNPLALIEFDVSGKAVHATLLTSSGVESYDEAIIDSLYGWRVDAPHSPALQKLGAGQTLKFKVRLVLDGGTMTDSDEAPAYEEPARERSEHTEHPDHDAKAPSAKPDRGSSKSADAVEADPRLVGTVTFFGLQAEGQRFLFMIDRSVSMAVQAKMDRTTDELMRCLRAMPDFLQFRVGLFNTDVRAFPATKFGHPTSSELDGLTRLLEVSQPWGGRLPSAAFERLLAHERPDAIFLLTDGALSQDEAQSILQQVRDQIGLIPVHCMALDADPQAAYGVFSLALSTGGQFAWRNREEEPQADTLRRELAFLDRWLAETPMSSQALSSANRFRQGVESRLRQLEAERLARADAERRQLEAERQRAEAEARRQAQIAEQARQEAAERERLARADAERRQREAAEEARQRQLQAEEMKREQARLSDRYFLNVAGLHPSAPRGPQMKGLQLGMRLAEHDALEFSLDAWPISVGGLAASVREELAALARSGDGAVWRQIGERTRPRPTSAEPPPDAVAIVRDDDGRICALLLSRRAFKAASMSLAEFVDRMTTAYALDRPEIERSQSTDPRTGETVWRFCNPSQGWWIEMGGALPDFVRASTCVPSPGDFR